MKTVELVVETVLLVVEVVEDATEVDERNVPVAVLMLDTAVLVEIVFGTLVSVVVATGSTIKSPILLPESSVK
jgi:hypothetical protein